MPYSPKPRFTVMTAVLALVCVGMIIVLSKLMMSFSKPPAKPKEVAIVQTKKNQLAGESSPYLLQHADNPVHWYPWSDAAFEAAVREDKPIFLSIGYSTCHWCHVMEEESFTDFAISTQLNSNFIAIKVDREERADIDQIYMSAVQAMTGQGGWPLSVFLTPDGKPFYGGTYFPPYARWGAPGFSEILNGIAQQWSKDRQKVLDAGESITNHLTNLSLKLSEDKTFPSTDLLEQAFHHFVRTYDINSAGFGSAPKFPMAHQLSWLMTYWYRSGDSQALSMVTNTLEQMMRGGIYDHIGGGFHRYATDAQWHVPHFEKMLYDQALISTAYLEAYQITNQDDFAVTARETLDYVLRDLKSSDGGFFSAEDADSIDPQLFEAFNSDPAVQLKKTEGAFYLWGYNELQELLDPQLLPIVAHYFDVTLKGNVVYDPHEQFMGKNILHRPELLIDTVNRFNLPVADVERLIEVIKKKMFVARSSRPRPSLDDKILTDWNGLMISAMSKAAGILTDEKYLQAAKEAADFVLDKLVDKDGRLLHRYRNGLAGIPGTLEDYAFFIQGLIDLYQVSFNAYYLSAAKTFAQDMITLFWDAQGKGFFLTAMDAKPLIIRPKEFYDGAIPSGNGVALQVLSQLTAITADFKWREYVHEALTSIVEPLSDHPQAYIYSLGALDAEAGSGQEVVLVGDPADDEFKSAKAVLWRHYVPHRVTLQRYAQDEQNSEIYQISSFIQYQKPSDQSAITVFVCRQFQCQRPVFSASELEALFTPE